MSIFDDLDLEVGEKITGKYGNKGIINDFDKSSLGLNGILMPRDYLASPRLTDEQKFEKFSSDIVLYISDLLKEEKDNVNKRVIYIKFISVFNPSFAKFIIHKPDLPMMIEGLEKSPKYTPVSINLMGRTYMELIYQALEVFPEFRDSEYF